MEDVRLKVWSKLEFKNPAEVLVRFRPFERIVAASSLPPKVKTLRTNRLRHAREIREAALFTYGISVALNLPTLEFAMIEDQDYDCVSRRIEGDTIYYTPIQLKRCVTESRSLTEEISKLSKYVRSNDLVVGLHVSVRGTIDFSKIHIPRLPISQLWFYGSISADQSRWMLIGDALGEMTRYDYDYPEKRKQKQKGSGCGC